jgi:hypothetical protein
MRDSQDVLACAEMQAPAGKLIADSVAENTFFV